MPVTSNDQSCPRKVISELTEQSLDLAFGPCLLANKSHPGPYQRAIFFTR